MNFFRKIFGQKKGEGDNDENKEDIHELIEILSNDRYVVGRRILAAEKLGKTSDPRIIEPLIKTLEDENDDVIYTVRKTLRDIGKPAIEPLINALEGSTIKKRCEILYIFDGFNDPRVLKILIEALSGKRVAIRHRAALSLGEIGGPQATEALVKALDDKNSTVRAGVTSALSRINTQDVVEPLIRSLKDKSPGVRYIASLHFGASRTRVDERAVDPLIHILKRSKIHDSRYFAACALGKIGDLKAFKPLIDALNDEYVLVRSASAEALGLLGDRKAVHYLNKLKWDKNNEVRKKAMESVEKLTSRPRVRDWT